LLVSLCASHTRAREGETRGSSESGDARAQRVSSKTRKRGGERGREKSDGEGRFRERTKKKNDLDLLHSLFLLAFSLFLLPAKLERRRTKQKTTTFVLVFFSVELID